MRENFKIGDKVYHIFYGWGEIIEDNRSIKMRVKFKDYPEHSGQSYSKEYVDVRLVSFTEYAINGLTQE